MSANSWNKTTKEAAAISRPARRKDGEKVFMSFNIPRTEAGHQVKFHELPGSPPHGDLAARVSWAATAIFYVGEGTGFGGPVVEARGAMARFILDRRIEPLPL